MKPLIIYHKQTITTDCPDGIAAAWVAAKAYDFDVELVGEIYRKDTDWEGYQLPFNPESRLVVFVDWTGYPVEVMEAIASECEKLIILDHHKTARDTIFDLSDRLPNVDGIYSPNQINCGATIAWNYFFPNEPQPWFMPYIFTRDTGSGGYWQGELPDHEAVNGALSFLRKSKNGVDAFPIFNALYDFGSEDFLRVLGEPEVVRKNELAWAEVNNWQRLPKFINPFDEYKNLLPENCQEEGVLVPFLEIQDSRADYVYSWVGTYLGQVSLNNTPYVLLTTVGDRNTIHTEMLNINKTS